jgi:CysZ protein
MKNTTSGPHAHDFSTGFLYPFRAGRFIIRNSVLYKYIFIPFIISVAVFSMAAYGGLSVFDYFVTQHLPQGDIWYWLILKGLIWISAILLTIIVLFFSFTVLGNLIASPFNDVLSERSEEILAGEVIDAGPFSPILFIKDTGKILLNEALKMSLFVCCMLFLFALNLVPVLGAMLYVVLAFLLTLYFLVIEYTGFVFSRKRLTLKDQRKFIRKNKLLCAGFGCGAFILLAIPFVQLFSIPMGVVGATLLCYDSRASFSKQQPEP